MAPIATETQSETVLPSVQDLKISNNAKTNKDSAQPAKKKLQWFSETGQPKSAYPYAHLLPSFDRDVTYPTLEPFEHVDPGHVAKTHADPRAFLAEAEIDNLTPDFGSEVSGVQLHKLDAAGRQQLALYVAQRGVVAFRDQDFVDQEPSWQIDDWGSFFGRNHVHPTSGQPKGYPELHLVYRAWGEEPGDGLDKRSGSSSAPPGRVSSVGWHSDVSYELQPPGLTALWLYDSPTSGGDTAYADARAAYRRLSPSFAAYLETLHVVHSGHEQAAYSRERGEDPSLTAYAHVRRKPVSNVHPLVRRHPVTGDKALYVNRVFSRKIVELKDEESAALLELLYQIVERGLDFQVRLRWRPRTVVLWDNRITSHSALADFDGVPGSRRHGARVTPQAERPFL